MILYPKEYLVLNFPVMKETLGFFIQWLHNSLVFLRLSALELLYSATWKKCEWSHRAFYIFNLEVLYIRSTSFQLSGPNYMVQLNSKGRNHCSECSKKEEKERLKKELEIWIKAGIYWFLKLSEVTCFFHL